MGDEGEPSGDSDEREQEDTCSAKADPSVNEYASKHTGHDSEAGGESAIIGNAEDAEFVW